MSNQGESFDDALLQAAGALRSIGEGRALTNRIAGLERELSGKDRDTAAALVTADGIDTQSLLAALTIKAAAGQINVVIHALGILVSLPYLLDRGEVIESLSLGAGNTGRRVPAFGADVTDLLDSANNTISGR